MAFILRVGGLADLDSPPDDPTILDPAVDNLPADLRWSARDIAAQPAGILPGVSFGAAEPSKFFWPGSPPVQGDNLLNNFFQSGPNLPLVVVLSGTASARIHVYSILARTSAGVSSLAVQDGSLFLIPAGFVALAAAITQVVWPVGLTIRENNSCTITLAAAGVGNTTFCLIQADRF
jgi:hypothetical protein